MQIDRHILRLALPSVVSNITVPLLGLIDLAIVGHLGSEHYIAAIAIGTTIFSMVYWLFAFLRMGTTAVISQAYGADDHATIRVELKRALLFALLIALVLLLMQQPLLALSLGILSPEAAVVPHASTYYHIAVWGAPAMLVNYCLCGWYVGMHDTRRPMMMAIVQNLTNIVVSLLFVMLLGMGVAGVALGTLVGVYAGMVYGLLGLRGRDLFASCHHQDDWVQLRMVGRIKRFMTVSRDIFFRTLCIVAVTVYFTSAGSRQGAMVLDANALLMQLFVIFSYFTDGLANAGEALAGASAGRGDECELRLVVRRLLLWGGGLAAAFACVYIIGAEGFLGLLTDQLGIIIEARRYLPWVWAVPFVGILAFVWDGVFIGMAYTRGMLLSMTVAAATFFGVWFALQTKMANHALWLAFDMYLLMRGLVQTILWLRRFRGRV